MPLWAQVGFFALTLVSCLAGTALGIFIADRLRKRRRRAARAPPPEGRSRRVVPAPDPRRMTDAAAPTLRRGRRRGIRRLGSYRLPAIWRPTISRMISFVPP